MNHAKLREIIRRMVLEELDTTHQLTRRPRVLPPSDDKFDVAKFKSLPTLTAMIQYANDTLPFVAEGSARLVYKLDAVHALKVAKDETKGTSQNEAESRVCMIQPDLFAKVVDHDPQFRWLMVEFAEPVSTQQFQAATGIPWKNYTLALGVAFAKDRNVSPNPSHVKMFNDLRNNVWFAKLLSVAHGCQFMPGDLAKLDSWGIVNNKLVVVDSGFTRAVHEKFYKQPTPSIELDQTQPAK